jgi:hypothetical protein
MIIINYAFFLWGCYDQKPLKYGIFHGIYSFGKIL